MQTCSYINTNMYELMRSINIYLNLNNFYLDFALFFHLLEFAVIEVQVSTHTSDFSFKQIS